MTRTPLGCLTNSLKRSHQSKQSINANHSTNPIDVKPTGNNNNNNGILENISINPSQTSTPYNQSNGMGLKNPNLLSRPIDQFDLVNGSLTKPGKLLNESNFLNLNQSHCSDSAFQSIQQLNNVDSKIKLDCQRSETNYCENPNRRLTNLSNYSLSSNPYPTGMGNLQTQSKMTEVNRNLLIPLNSQRLKPMRTFTRLAVINIFEDESVCLEFLANGSKLHQNHQLEELRVNEVIGINSQGRSIVIYQPNQGKGVLLDTNGLEDSLPFKTQCGLTNEPRMNGAPPMAKSGDLLMFYSLDNLPEKYWKKYQFAVK